MNRHVAAFLAIGMVSAWAASPVATADTFGNPYFGEDTGSSWTPWHSWGHESSMPVLSLDLNEKDQLNSAFRISAREDRLEDMKKFLQKGADVNSQATAGETALIYAARNCSPKMTTAILGYHPNVNLRDQYGCTALMYGIMGSCEPVVRLLMKAPGLRLGLRDKQGLSASDYAERGIETEVDGPAYRILRLLRARLDRRERVTAHR